MMSQFKEILKEKAQKLEELKKIQKFYNQQNTYMFSGFNHDRHKKDFNQCYEIELRTKSFLKESENILQSMISKKSLDNIQLLALDKNFVAIEEDYKKYMEYKTFLKKVIDIRKQRKEDIDNEIKILESWVKIAKEFDRNDILEPSLFNIARKNAQYFLLNLESFDINNIEEPFKEAISQLKKASKSIYHTIVNLIKEEREFCYKKYLNLEENIKKYIKLFENKNLLSEDEKKLIECQVLNKINFDLSYLKECCEELEKIKLDDSHMGESIIEAIQSCQNDFKKIKEKQEEVSKEFKIFAEKFFEIRMEFIKRVFNLTPDQLVKHPAYYQLEKSRNDQETYSDYQQFMRYEISLNRFIEILNEVLEETFPNLYAILLLDKDLNETNILRMFHNSLFPEYGVVEKILAKIQSNIDNLNDSDDKESQPIKQLMHKITNLKNNICMKVKNALDTSNLSFKEDIKNLLNETLPSDQLIDQYSAWWRRFLRSLIKVFVPENYKKNVHRFFASNIENLAHDVVQSIRAEV